MIVGVIEVTDNVAAIDKLVFPRISRKPAGHIGGSKLAAGNDVFDCRRVDNALPRQVVCRAGNLLLAVDTT
mgnify:CR=1 FL=1